MGNQKYSLLMFLAFMLVTGCAAQQRGWRAEGHFTGRAFEFGQYSNLGVQVSNDASLGKWEIDYAVLLSDLIRVRIEKRGVSTGPINSYVGSENYRDMKLSGRRVLIELGLSAKNTLTMSVVCMGERGPSFYFEPPQMISIQGSYSEPESFYLGSQAELTPLIDNLLDKAFAEISKRGLEP